MSNLQAMVRVLVVFFNLVTYAFCAHAQSLPEVPFDIEFANVSVHLTEPGRAQVKREIYRLYTNPRSVQRDIDALHQLTALVQPILKAANLPNDFRYAALPFADDEIDTFWSIQPKQAKDLNLRVNATVDERYHPIIATEAVVPYLSNLQRMYGNYVQTLLQYIRLATNSPEAQPAGLNSAYTLLDPASPPLIWKILARKLVIEREEPSYRPAASYVLYSYQNSGGQSLQDIARKLRIGDERMKPFNEWLRASAVPTDRAYPVLIRLTSDEYPDVKRVDESGWKTTLIQPADVGFPMLAKQQNTETGLRSVAIYYKINNKWGVQAQSCDNAITLAYYGRTQVRSLLQYNELTESDVIWPGNIYYLESKAKRAKVPFHVVQKSQTLRDVSNMYGVRLESLLFFNWLEPTQRVQPGRILWLQKRRPRKRPIEYQQLPVEETKPAEIPVLAKTDEPALPDSSGRQSEQVTSLPPDKNSPQSNVPIEIPAKSDSVASSVPTTVDSTQYVVDEPQENLKIHVVKPGQTYYAIARLYSVTVRQLYSWNNLSERIPLRIGQELILDTAEKPTRSSVKQKIVRNSKASNKPDNRAPWINSFVIEPARKVSYHVVKAGQTVYRVALINKVSIDNLMRWNALKNYTLEVGQKLLIRK